MVNTRKGGGIDLPTNPHNQRIIRQQQTEMNPLNPPPAGTDPGCSSDADASIVGKYYDGYASSNAAGTSRDAPGEARDAGANEARANGTTATTTNASSTTTSSTPGQEPGIHES
jgi:alkanesulfonate monooxygenase SsuD/methylene tetrahydromethanopterin reductase-like flavin-dependent oxidoreductase (luciferase family)